MNVMKKILMPRARFVALLATSALAGCAQIGNALTDNMRFRKLLEFPEKVDLALLGWEKPLAREYTERDISPDFRQNGFDPPRSAEYLRWSQNGWRGYQLRVDGLVGKPQSFTLQALKSQFARVAQITRHDCVEGWSVIGKWTGLRLGDLIAAVRPSPRARFVIFHCMDDDGQGGLYYESLNMHQAAHPQTLLAYELNDKPIPIKNGAPIRLKVPTQLGYKSAKYVSRITLVETLGGENGRGGYWEDLGYEWFAGI